MAAEGQDDGSTFDVIRAELERLKKINTLAAFRDADLPALAAAGASSEGGASVESAVGSAVAAVPSERHRRAAAALIGFDGDRWVNLKTRRVRAAAEMNCAPETFRQRDEASIIDEVARAMLERPSTPEPAPSPETRRSNKRTGLILAAAVLIVVGLVAALAMSDDGGDETTTPTATAVPTPTLAPSPTSTPTATPAPEPTVAAPTNASGPLDVTSWCVAVRGPAGSAEVTGEDAIDWACRGGDGAPAPIDFDGACELSYGEGAVAINLTNDPYAWQCEPDFGATSGQGCPIAAGAFAESKTDEFSRFAGAFTRIWADEGGGVCPATIMHRWGEGIIQELGRTPGQAGFLGAILARDPETVVLLDGSAWQAYAQVIGLSPGLVGYPVGSVDDSLESTLLVPLSAGGALVARDTSGQFHFIPGVGYTVWLADGGVAGCLGAPVSNPYAVEVGFRQDYEGGALILDAVQGRIVTEGPCG